MPGPNAVNQLSLGEADRPLRAAAAQYSLKNNKYRFISEQIGYKFFPIIFESSGKMHNHTSSFFKIVLNTITGCGPLVQTVPISTGQLAFRAVFRSL